MRSMATQKKTAKSSIRTSSKTKKSSEFASFAVEKKSEIGADKQRINKKSALIGAIVVVILLVFAYLNRGLFVAAIVNGQPVYRLQVIQQLESKGGKQTLNTITTKMLIMQEARKKNILISQKEIHDQIKEIEKKLSASGQSLDSALESQGQTKQDLREQIEIQKIAEKLFAKESVVSEAELNKYFEENKAMLQGETDEEKKKNAKQQLQQQKLATKFQDWLAKLQKNAKIVQFVNY